MSQISLTAEKRDDSGKGVARKLRASGRIPGVLYGKSTSPQLFSADEKVVAALMKEHGLNFVLELELEGKKHTCMIADYQRDVFQRFVTHLDLKVIDIKDKVVVKIPVALTGDADVRARGGIAQLYMRELTVKTLPTEIQKVFTIDVSKMRPGETLRLSEVAVSDTLEKMDPPHTTVVNILAPRALAAARQQSAS